MDVQTVWQCGQRDIRVSTDGGQAWESTGVAPGRDCTVSFVDAQTGWVFGSLATQATADGGQTWTEIALPEGVQRATAISLRTPDEGYLLTPDAALYATRDGGESWSRLPLDLEAYGELTLLPSNLATAAIRFFDADTGVVVLSLVGGGQSKVVALRTTDGGQTWTEEEVPAEPGVLYLTRDGRFLTVHSLLKAGTITVLEHK